MNRKSKIGIIGLGYIGLPLAIEFSKKYPTFGFDKNEERIRQLIDGIDKTLEVEKKELNEAKITYTTEIKDIVDCNTYIVTVPTPVDKYNNPAMESLASASKMVGKILNAGDVVIYESTVYPGATEEFCVPILEKESGLTYNADFFCGYSPEMILAGRRINEAVGKYIADNTITEMVKSGINPVGAKVAVLGITFKENCPDLRNSKVPDIINHLNTYDCEIKISDPFADVDQAKDCYAIDLLEKDQLTNCDAVIVAVSHDDYKKIAKEKWQEMFNGSGVFIDVKSIYENNFFTDTNIIHWRL